jgi:hypothetical protein
MIIGSGNRLVLEQDQSLIKPLNLTKGFFCAQGKLKNLKRESATKTAFAHLASGLPLPATVNTG